MDFGIDYEEWGQKFIQNMKKEDNEINVSSRKDFSIWLCR